jgi:DNA-binding PadR family transcriptional regulator
MSLEESIEARILKCLYSFEMKGRPETAYKREIARGVKVSERAAYTYLQTLTRKGLIEVSEQKGIQRFYKLTDKGRAMAWALLNPDALAALYETEETVRNIGVRLPQSLSGFYADVESLTEDEENLLIQCGSGKANKAECSRRFSELKKMRADLVRRFETSRGSLVKEIQAGGIPYAAFSRLESFNDLVFLQSLISFSNLDRKVEELTKVVSDLRRELRGAGSAVAGLQRMRNEGIMAEKEFFDRKDLYEGKMRKIQQLLDKIKQV